MMTQRPDSSSLYMRGPPESPEQGSFPPSTKVPNILECLYGWADTVSSTFCSVSLCLFVSAFVMLFVSSWIWYLQLLCDFRICARKFFHSFSAHEWTMSPFLKNENFPFLGNCPIFFPFLWCFPKAELLSKVDPLQCKVQCKFEGSTLC